MYLARDLLSYYLYIPYSFTVLIPYTHSFLIYYLTIFTSLPPLPLQNFAALPSPRYYLYTVFISYTLSLSYILPYYLYIPYSFTVLIPYTHSFLIYYLLSLYPLFLPRTHILYSFLSYIQCYPPRSGTNTWVSSTRIAYAYAMRVLETHVLVPLLLSILTPFLCTPYYLYIPYSFLLLTSYTYSFLIYYLTIFTSLIPSPYSHSISTPFLCTACLLLSMSSRSELTYALHQIYY